MAAYFLESVQIPQVLLVVDTALMNCSLQTEGANFLDPSLQTIGNPNHTLQN